MKIHCIRKLLSRFIINSVYSKLHHSRLLSEQFSVSIILYEGHITYACIHNTLSYIYKALYALLELCMDIKPMTLKLCKL